MLQGSKVQGSIIRGLNVSRNCVHLHHWIEEETVCKYQQINLLWHFSSQSIVSETKIHKHDNVFIDTVVLGLSHKMEF
jgi:hypothetical protein